MVAKDDEVVTNGVHNSDEFDMTIDDIELEDIDERILLDDIYAEEPSERDTEDSCLIVDGIPVVGAEKLVKLKNVLGKLFKKYHEDYIDHYPLDESGQSKGYCFVEFPTAAIAAIAAETLENYRLDKSHMFSTNLFSDIKKFTEPDPDWEPPTEREYKDHGNLWWWCEQPSCTDQYAIQYEGMKNKVSVYWNMPNEPVLVNDKKSERQNWTETVTRWSPNGTYLATLHARGVALWGGAEFDQLYRYAHNNVVYCDFSPCEKYLVTYAKHENMTYTEVPDGLRVWHIRTGEVLRSFPVGRIHRITHWPHFRWSHDGSYFASPKVDGEPGISVYETPSTALIGKKSIKVDRLRDLQWSPSANILAYWIEESSAQPARVTIMRLPDKTELRTMNLFRVADATMYWQANGDFLAVKVERYNKKREDEKSNETRYSKLTHQLEILRINQKDVPVDSVECKEPVVAFGWEPTGDKFCALLGYSRKSTPTFYQVTESSVQCIKTLEPQQGLTSVCWAPHGGWLVIASLRGVLHDVPGSGQMYFIDTNGNDVTLVNKEEHATCSQIQFDPTGRFAVSMVLVHLGERASDFGYRIYSSQGRCLMRKSVEAMTSFQWRPRPKSVLPDSKLKEIKRNMKEYSKKFEEQDKRDKGRASKEVLKKRREDVAYFKTWHDVAMERFNSEIEEREILRDYLHDDETLEEEVIEVPLSTDRIVLDSRPIAE